MRRIRLLLWPGGVALGIAGEAALYGLGDTRHWVPDLAAGWSLIACGLVAWSRRPDSRTGAAMTATGAAWFVGNFVSQALYLYRGPLVQLVLGYPSGRIRTRVERGAVAIGYGAASVVAVWRSEVATIALSALLLAVAVYGWVKATGRERRERLAAVVATGGVALVLAGNAAARLAFPDATATSATLLVYQLALCALAVALLVGLLVRPWARGAVTDLVVEIGDSRSGTVRDALARALGDPTLEVGFWLPETGTFVDAGGRTVDRPAGGSARRVTHVEREGRTVAVLVHDPSVLDDARLVDAVDAAARLAASNARLQAEVRGQLDELKASRRRVVQAGDEERMRLEQRLREGAERRLTDLARALGDSAGRANQSPGTAVAVERAQGHLAGTLAELHELAGGLHPRVLGEQGLADALSALAERSSVPVKLAPPAGRFPREIEAAVYFVCSEALANVVKYASASVVSISVPARDGCVLVEVADDGVGGADPALGSGIRGLTDRAEALGGTLRVDSPPGRGTRLHAEFPLDGRA